MSEQRTTETITADQWTIAIGRDCEVLFGREAVRNVIQQTDGMYHIYCEGHDTAYGVYSTAELTITWLTATASVPTDAGRVTLPPTWLEDDYRDMCDRLLAVAKSLELKGAGRLIDMVITDALTDAKAENAALQRQLADLQAFYDMMVGLDYENEALEALNAEIPPFPDNQETIRQIGNWADFSVLCEGLRESQAARRDALNAAGAKAGA